MPPLSTLDRLGTTDHTNHHLALEIFTNKRENKRVTPVTMKLPSSSLLASIALAGLPLLSASAINDVDSNSIDAGILDIHGGNSSNEAPFFRDLQSTCPETCSSALCDCVSQYGFAEPCSQQLHDVCTGTAGSIEDCVVPEYVFYYQNVYCPFAACRVSGESYEKCLCDSYINFCGIYQNKAGYETDPKTLKYCSISTCCQGAKDDEDRKTSCLDGTFQNEAVTSISNLIDSVESENVEATTAEENTNETTELDDAEENSEVEVGEPPAGAHHVQSSATYVALATFLLFTLT
jgi:hypothetical protein